MDLVSIAERQGFTVKRVGSYYTLKEHDSIRIKNRRSWLRFSVPEGQDGHNGDNIEFLRQFCYMDFREAVIYLLNEAGYRYEDKSFKDDTSRKNHERRKEEQNKEQRRERGVCASRTKRQLSEVICLSVKNALPEQRSS